MCQPKPGVRCKIDTAKHLAAATTAYKSALAAHAQNLDDPATGERLERAAQKLWERQLEHAAAHVSGPRPANADWRTNVAYNLSQAHADQAALMPAHPGSAAPAHVRDAYHRLADARDRLARVDAVIAADEQNPLSDRPQPGPMIGRRPSSIEAEEAVAAAEYAYAHALHPERDTTPAEAWRHLMNKGQMPYDPFSNTLHPNASQTAPWVRQHREARPVDVPQLRRASGLGDEVYWDVDEHAIVVTPDRDEWMDAHEHEAYTSGIEASMWQLGYHTARDGGTIKVSRVPDVGAWAAKASEPVVAEVA